MKGNSRMSSQECCFGQKLDCIFFFFFKKGTIYTRLELACSWSDITTREIEKRKREAVGVVHTIMFQIAALSLNRPEQIVCKITQGTLLWVKHLNQTTQRLPQCEFVVDFLNLVNMFVSSEKRWITAFESCLLPDFGRGDNSSAVVRAVFFCYVHNAFKVALF